MSFILFTISHSSFLLSFGILSSNYLNSLENNYNQVWPHVMLECGQRPCCPNHVTWLTSKRSQEIPALICSLTRQGCTKYVLKDTYLPVHHLCIIAKHYKCRKKAQRAETFIIVICNYLIFIL